MMSDVDQTPVTREPLSVREVLSYLNSHLEQYFNGVFLEAEISSMSFSGRHCYLTLKDLDADAKLQAAQWNYVQNFAAYANSYGFTVDQLKVGAKIQVFGKLQVYERNGGVSLHIIRLRLIGGIGEQMQRIERIRQQIIANGWHLPEFKKTLPRFPQRIGLVTSPNASGLQDMIKIFNQQGQDIELVVYEALVQGEHSVESLVAAINLANAENQVDMLIVGRGGGAFEDLISFSDEQVVLAILNSQLPVLSAVGHETDNPLSDLVADFHCVTPTAAAQYVCRPRVALADYLYNAKAGLTQLVTKTFEQYAYVLMNLEERLANQDPIQTTIIPWQQYLGEVQHRLGYVLTQHLNASQTYLSHYRNLLDTSINNHFKSYYQQLQHYREVIQHNHPQVVIQRVAQQTQVFAQRLQYVFNKELAQKSEQLATMQHYMQHQVQQQLAQQHMYVLGLKQQLEQYNPIPLVHQLSFNLQQQTSLLQQLYQAQQQQYQREFAMLTQSLQQQAQSNLLRVQQLAPAKALYQARYGQLVQQKLQQFQQELKYTELSLASAMRQAMQHQVYGIDNLAQKLISLDPYLPLERGYAMLLNAQDQPITSATQLVQQQQVSVLLKDAKVSMQVQDITPQQLADHKLKQQQMLAELQQALQYFNGKQY